MPMTKRLRNTATQKTPPRHSPMAAAQVRKCIQEGYEWDQASNPSLQKTHPRRTATLAKLQHQPHPPQQRPQCPAHQDNPRSQICSLKNNSALTTPSMQKFNPKFNNTSAKLRQTHNQIQRSMHPSHFHNSKPANTDSMRHHAMAKTLNQTPRSKLSSTSCKSY